jgi:hypothetical protein
MKPIALSKQAKEAMRRAGRARIRAGVWRANGFRNKRSARLLRSRINSNRRLLALTRRALKDIDGIGDDPHGQEVRR